MAQSAQTLSQHTPARGLVCRALVLSAAFFIVLTASAQEYQSPDYPSAQYSVASASSPDLIPDSVTSPSVDAVRHFFDAQPETEYHLYDGDEVKIDVAGHLELSSTQTIGPDGRVTVPLAGSIVIAGLKRDDASVALAHALTRYYHMPYVTVTVTKYSSYRLIILGNVQRPGEMLFDRPPTLLEALARAGVGSLNYGSNLVGPEAALANNATANGMSNIAGLQAWRCLIYRGDSAMAWVDIRGLLSGEAFGDLHLQRDDVILLPTETKFISVLGAVSHPGPQHLMPQVTLQEVIAVAGGLAPAAGNNPLITIIDPSTNKSRTVKYMDLMTSKGVNSMQLHAGDVIFVPTSKVAKVGYVLQQLSPITDILTFSALGAEYF
jgi:polysaccharide export outer membrane protein